MRRIPVHPPAAIAALALVLLTACPSAEPTASDEPVEEPAPPAEPEPDPLAVYRSFELEDGACAADGVLTIELGDGVEQQMAIRSAFAETSIAITSNKGDVVKTRSGSAYTLYLADYPIDPAAPGVNPPEEHAKLELTLITQDHAPIQPEVYRVSKRSNFVAGPNLFHGGRAWPMKDNFVGGVKVTSVDGHRICGEIRVRSKFDVSIIGKFEAEILN